VIEKGKSFGGCSIIAGRMKEKSLFMLSDSLHNKNGKLTDKENK